MADPAAQIPNLVPFTDLLTVFQVLRFAEERAGMTLSSPFPDSQLDAIGCLPMTLAFILLSAEAHVETAVSNHKSRDYKHSQTATRDCYPLLSSGFSSSAVREAHPSSP